MDIQLLNSFAEIVEKFELFWFDLWGVTHNGEKPFSGALDCLNHLKKLKKNVWFLSNAPRLPEFAAKKLSEMGIESSLYAGICTSGLVCHIDLKERFLPFYQTLKPNLYHLGPERDTNIFKSINFYKSVSHIEQADFLLITGTWELTDTLDMYEPLLRNALKYNLPAICANADLEVMCGDLRAFCAGAIAKLYQDMGGKVITYGKPEQAIYEKIFTLSQDHKKIDKSKILMVGDSLYTDISGANRFGIQSLLVGSGILEQELKHVNLDTLCINYGATPNYFIDLLRF